MGDADAVWSLAAFEEFYDRHKSYLWKVCSDVGKKLSCTAWIEDVFNETFLRAKKNAAKFKFPQCPGDEEDNVIKGWLGTIARNRLCDYWRKSRNERTGSDAQWEALAEEFAAGASTEETRAEVAPAQAKRLALIDEAMLTLSERDAHVLRVTSQFVRRGKKFPRLPNAEVDALASTLNTTPENLRKIRERARKKIRLYVDERGA